MATYRNALNAAYLESMHIKGDDGLFIESLLETWSRRDPLVLTEMQIATMHTMHTMLADAGAEKCLSLFNAAVRGTRVLA